MFCVTNSFNVLNIIQYTIIFIILFCYCHNYHSIFTSIIITFLTKNVPIDLVSRSMGHSKVSTTLDIYLHQEKNTTSVFLN